MSLNTLFNLHRLVYDMNEKTQINTFLHWIRSHKQFQSMHKNTLTVPQRHIREFRRSPNHQVAELRLESVSKVPKLQEIIDEWKFQMQADKTNLDHSLLSMSNSLDDKDIFIDHLTKKVDNLQSKLNKLCEKHVEVCGILCRQLEKKTTFESILKKQNIELNKEMKTLMESMRQIANKLYNKNDGRVLKSDQRSAKLKIEKENALPLNIRSNGDIFLRRSPPQERSKSRPKLLSNRSKHNHISSALKSDNSQYQLDYTNIKKDNYQQPYNIYYKKSKRINIKNSQLVPQGTLLERSRHIAQRGKCKTTAGEQYR